MCFSEIDWSQYGDETLGLNLIKFDFGVTVNYSAIAVDFKVVISMINFVNKSGETNGPEYMLTTFSFDDLIIKIACTTKNCLVLLESGELYKINISTLQKEKLNFLDVEADPLKKPKSFINSKEKIVDISSSENFCVATTNFNSVYNIPNKTYQFTKCTKLKKLVCGAEHAVLLTTNGDIYTWGVGLRGQLGHGDIKTETVPRLVQSLSGIKISDVSAGAWHTAAVSIFGDLYVWGWNSQGQLGLKVFDYNRTLNTSSKFKMKNQTVYTVPTLCQIESESGELNIVKVFCGSKHTVIRTANGKVFLTGSNNHGQLGLEQNRNVEFPKWQTKLEIFNDQFHEMEVKVDFTKFSCYAAYSCFALIENK